MACRWWWTHWGGFQMVAGSTFLSNTVTTKHLISVLTFCIRLSFLSSSSNLHLYPMHGQYPSFYPSFSISTLPCTSPMHLPMSADSGRVLPDIQMIRILMMMILTIVLMVTSMSCRASGKICNLLRYFDGEKMLMMIAPLVQAMMMRR